MRHKRRRRICARGRRFCRSACSELGKRCRSRQARTASWPAVGQLTPGQCATTPLAALQRCRRAEPRPLLCELCLPPNGVAASARTGRSAPTWTSTATPSQLRLSPIAGRRSGVWKACTRICMVRSRYSVDHADVAGPRATCARIPVTLGPLEERLLAHWPQRTLVRWFAAGGSRIRATTKSRVADR